MSEIKRVKIQNIVDSQIPEFLSDESPLFREFLEQYYISQEHQTGAVNLAENLPFYKSIENFNNETFFTKAIPCVLTEEIVAFDDVISVNHTIGFPSKYGLLKINDEIITYTGKTNTTFTGCIRGFSGIDKLSSDLNSEVLSFSTTSASSHSNSSVVENLNLIFYDRLFTKFKSQFIPGFENRTFAEGIKIKNILTRARDFYSSKGTDTAFKLLFSILYDKKISVIKPQDYLLRPSDNNYIVTKNVLVEKLSGGDPLQLNGKTLYQDIANATTASASIYNVEFRPLDNVNLYEISLDSESFISNFTTTKTTKVLEDVSIDSNYIFVDSTVGFPNSGKLLIKSKVLTNTFTVEYTDKNTNQFLGVTGLNFDLTFDDIILEDNVVYSFLDDQSEIRFRLINVIDDVDYSKTSNLRVGDKVALSSFGIDLSEDPKFNNWIYNVPTYHEIKTITSPAASVWRVEFYDSIDFYYDETLKFLNLDDENDIIRTAKVTNILSDNIIEVESTFGLSGKTRVEKTIAKASSNKNNFPSISILPSNVQNTYIDSDRENFYIAASGLPSYKLFSENRKIDVSTLAGAAKTTVLETASVHNFYTGEKIYYFSSANSGINTGIYHVTTIGNPKDSTRIKLSYSKNDLFAKKYIEINPGITSDYFVKLDYQNKDLFNQKIFKKFKTNNAETVFVDKESKKTNNRQVGILANGVEIYSPTLYDENIYYGTIESIEITNFGSGYDVINYPRLDVLDQNGIGADVHLNVTGSLKEVKIITPGIGYQTKPKITLIGGNGSGAVIEPNLVRSQIVSGFKGDGGGVNPTNDTITFIENHNFDDGEEVIYDSNFNSNLNPLVSNSTYFVGIESSRKLKLYATKFDAIQKVNNINLVGISSGFHRLKSLNSKNTITKIYVKNSGSGYSNKKITVPSILSFDGTTNGVNTFDDYIFAKNHNFKTKDLVRYSYSTTAISGLSTETQYYVTVIDSNRFKLSEAGIGTSLNDSNFNNKKYTSLGSLGVGTHTFAYPPIEIVIESLSGIGSTTAVKPTLKPVVTGSVDSVFITDGGIGYGSSDIINFHRRPYIGISSITSEALLKPIILNGSIVDVQILNFGRGYNEGIDIVVNGAGSFAELDPIIENGRIVNVNVINGGIGYDKDKTSLSAVRRGTDAKFIGNIFEWKINQVEKNKNLLSLDDEGIIVPSRNQEFGLQFVHFYPPKILRKTIDDHINNDNKEVINGVHSPIIGWAYDGNPIYGPYGQVDSEVRRVRSSYIKDVEANPLLRPDFLEGFFVQDYSFSRASGDLDEYNGRFCITPEFPNGTYAYFMTIDSNPSSSPIYPYLIGDHFKSNPILENFNSRFNQDEFSNQIESESISLIRNLGPYYVNSTYSGYGLIEKIKPKYKQEFLVDEIYPSSIDDLLIYSRGNNYKVSDNLVFDNVDTGGTGASAAVSRIRGKGLYNINVGVTTFNDVYFSNYGNSITVDVGFPHNLLNGDKVLISGISTNQYSEYEGFKSIFVQQIAKTGIVTDIADYLTTGDSTNVFVTDIGGYEVNDYIQIDSEILRITSIDPDRLMLSVDRISNIGVHTAGISSATLLPRKFVFSSNSTNQKIQNNKTLYFSSKTLVGFGTTGSNYELFDGQNLFVPPKTIYIKDHNLFTGQQLGYNVGIGGTGLLVSDSNFASAFNLIDNQTLYAVRYGKDYLGISTVGFTTSSGISTTNNSLFIYDSIGVTGASHSITTRYPNVTGRVENFFLNATTESNHNLLDGDRVKFNLIPNLVETISLRYDLELRKVTTSLKTFDTVLTDSSEIVIPNSNLKTGDKIVYYDEGNTPIGGLTNNKVYYVIKNHPDRFNLANTQYDSIVGNSIVFSSAGTGTQSIALINPPVEFTNNNIIVFDLSDPSLSGMDLKLFRDLEFSKQLETYKYTRNSIEAGSPNAKLTINTRTSGIEKMFYYTLLPLSPIAAEKYQISSDSEVFGRNKVTIVPSKYIDEYSIVSTGSTSFKINFNGRPETTTYTTVAGISSIFYDTNSPNTTGAISKLKVNFGGKGYKKIPRVVSVASTTGSGAIIRAISSTIGRIDLLERVKDGYDYPTDKTLKPFLSIPTVAQISGISRIENVGIVTGGKGYNRAPRLKVIGNDDIRVSCEIQGGSIVRTSVDQNVFNLSSPLRIVPTRNSNGYDIDDIVVAGNNVTLELSNSDTQIFPFIATSYGGTEIDFPFSVGDQIFIENCRINLTEVDGSGNIVQKDNFNSSDYGYRFFTVTGINTTNFTVTYSMDGISNNLGEYTSDFNYGFVVNRRDMSEFEMNIIDDLSYFSGEQVFGYDSNGTNTFTAVVMQNGWDNNINQLRMIDSKGELNVGDTLYGERSRLNGIVEIVNDFNLESTLGVFRDKVNSFGDNIGYLNDYQQRISDNNYYQKFSYSIKSELNYETWKESVKTLIHPAGLKEFSDLDVVGIVTDGTVNVGISKSSDMRVTTGESTLDLLINIDQQESVYNRYNFSMVTEEESLPDGSVERIFFPEGVELRPYILSKTNKVIKIDDISPQFTGFTTTIGGEIVGLSTFKLTSNSVPLFHRVFDSSDASIVDLSLNRFNINFHNFQSGQTLYYSASDSDKIGIATTSFVDSSVVVINGEGQNQYISVASTESSIIMEIGAGVGSAIYENGYNVAISTTISGVSSAITPNFSSLQSRFYGFPTGFEATSLTGIGTGAKFSAFIVYNSSTGQPISTSVVLVDGGRGYGVGDTVSISGTYFGGSSPTNDLSFNVSKVANTNVPPAANGTFLNIPGITVVGLGTGATFNVSRDSVGDISSIELVNGGVGYALSDRISIAGTYVGGSSPADDIFLSPTVLGTDKLPSKLYVDKVDNTAFNVSGLSTSTNLNLTSLGIGTQTFTLENPNANVMIQIDNIIQTPVYIRDFDISLSQLIGIGSSVIYVSNGISSITTLDVFNIGSEYLKVKSIGIGSTNAIGVVREFFGSVSAAHSVGAAVTIVRGDFNIVEDAIHFSTPPYGPIGPDGVETRSTFQGRAFSRRYDPQIPNDRNFVLDDISDQFTGIAATEFILKSNKNDVVGLFTDTNSVLNSTTDINNNPVILINNVPQISEVDFTIDTPGQNTIRFLSGTPKAGQIVRVAITTGYGYQPLVAAAATVQVSAAGSITNIYLNGFGSGYRTAPTISIISSVGSGATFTSTIGSGGTVTSLAVVNAGSGYTSNPLPKVIVDSPAGYSDLPLVYTGGTTGIGQDAKASVSVGFGSSITQFKLETFGISYKVGDVLAVSGIVTDPSVGIGFSEFRITVLETLTDKFGGFYPGQFVKFDDISSLFNGLKTKFTLTVTQGGVTDILSLKVDPSTDLKIENNLFVYINDVLQEPIEAYTFTGSRLIFKEAPKAGSKCYILFYRGSDLDVEQIDPPKTIKEGDIVQIGENILDPFDRPQFDRVVKRIISSNSLDTFTYDSLGINTDPLKERPLKWTKQTTDLIINGVLYSKSRPDLKSRITPTTKIIKNVGILDDTIYVNNAFPLFTEVDQIAEDLRDIEVVENREITPSLASAVVSTATSISSINIDFAGVGYAVTNSPFVAISSSRITKKDPIYSWNSSSGISTDYNFNSIVYGTALVSVGSSGLIATSNDGVSWNVSNIGYGGTVSFNHISFASTNKYIAVGSTATAVFTTGVGSTLDSWQEYKLYRETFVIGNPVPVVTLSPFVGEFYSSTYSTLRDTVVVVGSDASVFTAVGIGSTGLFQRTPPSFDNLNSVTNNEAIFVAVGDGGIIIHSEFADIWSRIPSLGTSEDLKSIIWDQSKFVVCGYNGTILTSPSGFNSWQILATDVSENFEKIAYYDGFYTALTSSGDLYYSFNLTNWVSRSTLQSNVLNDLIFVNSFGDNGRYIAVGSAGTAIYSEPVYNRATAVSSASGGIVTSITITNGGFGYSPQVSPPIVIGYDTTKSEKVFSIKAKGDFGIIKSIGVGATTIDFTLESENYDNATLGLGYTALNSYGVEYSGLEVGDYFVIYESNSIAGHALTGISTYLGGLGNYPDSKVGTAVSFLDGLYRVERVTAPAAGIVTVGCNFALSPSGGSIQVNAFTNPKGYMGRYTWGKIYDFQNRSREDPQSFIVNVDNGIIGLSTAPDVYRTRGVV